MLKAPAVWIQTLPALGSSQGRHMDLVNPTPAMVDFRTIATVLARVPRFGGQTGGGVLSVAQHCLEGALALDDAECAAAFLIHDAHEAYMGDIATPVAKAIRACAVEGGYGDGESVAFAIQSLKARLDRAIYTAAGIAWPLPPHVAEAVKDMDRRMLETERRARMPDPPFSWSERAEPVPDADLYPWSTGSAEAFYWRACCELLPCFRKVVGCDPG